jgi:hypothetical protein
MYSPQGGKTMSKQKLTLVSILAVFALLFAFSTAAFAVVQSSEEPTYTENWDGRGTDSEKCGLVGQEGRPETGWIHWIFSTKGDSTDAELVLGGTGIGTYDPGEPLDAETWHFYTPYFEIDGLTATINLFGGDPGPGGGLVISDYCPGVGVEHLTVTKTVETSFTREHFWDIDKSVTTEEGHELDDTPKIWLYTDGSGDEKATWTVDVTYEGYKDSDFNVSGGITIKNTGTLDAVIIGIVDKLGGTEIVIDCGEDFELPYTLLVDETLTCTYDEDVEGKIDGDNVVTVTTQRNKEYSDTKPIIWDAPTTEINRYVEITDTNPEFADEYGEVKLDAHDYDKDDVIPFTYEQDFAYEDYGECGSFPYINIAKVIGDDDVVLAEASATLKVNVQCFVYETAYAKGDNAVCFIPTFANWGWTNPIEPETYEMDLWAAAAQCDTDKGTLVGTVTVVYGADGNVTVTFNVDDPYLLETTAVYAGYEKFPRLRNGRFTVAPGQYTNNSPFAGTQVYVIAHAVVGLPDPEFGPNASTTSTTARNTMLTVFLPLTLSR